MHSNNQELFNQKAVDIVGMPQDSKILPVHVLTSVFFIVGGGF